MSVAPTNQEISYVPNVDNVPVVNQTENSTSDNYDVVMNTNDNDDTNTAGTDDESIVTSFCDITGSDRESGRHFLEVSLYASRANNISTLSSGTRV